MSGSDPITADVPPGAVPVSAPRPPAGPDPQTGLHSAVYRGRVRHRRFGERPHAFSYDLSMLYLDLDELPRLFRGRWLWSLERFNWRSFRRRDYLGPADVPLRQAVLDRVEERLGHRPGGAVRLLTHLATAGLCFNPVSFYYVFEADGALAAVVAEITNTPWGERHAYVLPTREAQGDGRRHAWTFAKAFHVSPFLPMDLDYVWHLDDPGERLTVHMEDRRGDELVFDATLTLERRPWTARSLAACLVRQPVTPLKVLGAIYWQALRLWLQRAPFHVHPRKLVP